MTTTLTATLTPATDDVDIGGGTHLTDFSTIVEPTGTTTTASVVLGAESFTWHATVELPYGATVTDVAISAQVAANDATAVANSAPNATLGAYTIGTLTGSTITTVTGGTANGGGQIVRSPNSVGGPLAGSLTWTTTEIGVFLVQGASESVAVGPTTIDTVTFTIDDPIGDALAAAAEVHQHTESGASFDVEVVGGIAIVTIGTTDTDKVAGDLARRGWNSHWAMEDAAGVRTVAWRRGGAISRP